MQSKSTKKSLIASGLALLTCCALLAGTTFAWFTDSVVNKNNKIQAGKLDITLSELKTDGNYVEVGEDPIFDYSLWEPGYSDTAVLRVTNAGSLALKWNLRLTANGDAGILGDVIDVYAKVSEGTAITTIPSSLDAAIQDGYTNVGTLNQLIADPDGAAHGVLYAATNKPAGGYSEAYAGIVLHMRESAGNAYQGESIGSTFDIVLNATQYTYEKDGFDNENYDANIAMVTPDTIKDAVDNLPEGGTLMLSEGVYDATDLSLLLYKKSAIIEGAGADKTVIKGVVRFGTNDSHTSYENGNWTLKGVTIVNDANAPQQMAVALMGNEVASNSTFTIEDCVINGFQFGAQIGGSQITNSTLTVKNTTFVNCACAMSVGGSGNELVMDNVSYEGVTYAWQDYRNGNTYYTPDGAEVDGGSAQLGNSSNTISVNGTRYSSIEDAMAAANAAGNTTVYLAGGEYKAVNNETLKVTADNVILKGAGADVTVIDAGTTSVSGQGALIVSADNVTVRDLTVQTSTQNRDVAILKVTDVNQGSTPANVKIQNVTLRGTEGSTPGHGLNLHGVNGATVDGLKIYSYTKCGISLANATGVTVANTTTATGGWADIGCMYSNNGTYETPCSLTIDDSNAFGNGNIYSERPTSATGGPDEITYPQGSWTMASDDDGWILSHN